MKHEYYDIIVTGVEKENNEDDAVRIKFDTTRDEDNGQFLILTKEDVVEIGKILNLVMFDKVNLLGDRI